jgi:GGDEF domain-containing protein
LALACRNAGCVLGTVAADGEPIARSDNRQGTSWIGDPVFEQARLTQQASIQILISPVVGVPILSMGVPVLDAEGHFVGMVAASVEATRVADRIAAELARPIRLLNTEVVMTASIGIAVVGPGSSAMDLLRKADQAMYRAKRTPSDDTFSAARSTA